MKTSFYFVVWILIYPLLELTGSRAVAVHSFILALFMVWGLSWLINRFMWKFAAYDSALEVAAVLEDVFTGNVDSFRRRLTRMAVVETLTAAYYVVCLIVIGKALLEDVGELVPFVVFVILGISAIRRSIRFIKADSRLKANYCNEECLHIVDDTFGYDYEEYYNERINHTYEEMLAYKPRYFTVYRISSLIIAIVASLFGLAYFALGLYGILDPYYGNTAAAGMVFLYGSLALYYGIKDIVACTKTPARASAPEKIEVR